MATQRLHVAIALVILSHKPPQQSLPSYILDLKARFPLEISSSQVDHKNLHPRLLDEDDPWRKRALALEVENEALKLRAQKQELEVLALKSTALPSDDPNADSQPSQAAKKKRKTHQVASKLTLDKQDLRALVKDLRSGPCLPALKDSLDVLSSFRRIQLLDASAVQPESEEEAILIPNIKRSLTSLGNLLDAVLARNASVVAVSSRVDVVGCLCNLLLSLLDSTLPLRPRHAILPHILSELTMCIVRPSILAFHALSVHQITSGLNEKARKTVYPDIRPDLLCVLRRLLECLRALKARTRDLREFMIFEAAKEVESLWNSEDTTQLASGRHTREQRIDRLARKDALWYHCSILHVALDQFPPSTASDAGDHALLSSEAVRVLANLIHHFEHQTPVDEAAKGMVLAVVEKAWLTGLRESPAEEEGFA